MNPPGKPRLCSLTRGAEGYGFNLHGEKGQHGQYIRAVDEGSPAERAGLRTGDRVIEVDGTNIERETHTQVVARIKAGGGSTRMLVVDRELDAYCRRNGITIKASMAEDSESPRINGDHLEVESEVHMNGDAEGMGSHEVVVATLEAEEQSAPERQEEDEEEEEEEHQYSEINRREEREDEDEDAVDEQFASALADVEIEDERREVEEDAVVTAEDVAMEESIPAPPIDREEDPDVNIPEPEPEPLLEAATVPVVESAPPVDDTETDGPGYTEEPEPEPVREPTPEPAREPTPEPAREPTPEPVREPTPEPEPEPKPVHQPTRSESVPPSRPTAPPTTRQASLNADNKANLELASMEKARILAAGRKKKKQASSKNWEDKYAAFNNL